ncbi:dienelactone hydrolase family protein [Melghirimyces profundicolus]|uniref:Dienelactone hydrolase family protein n=1 Tax=Melghirimyces profundicolus TaxID=1242148 RepID=A0A2T6B602_9BACL|nr:alpha/beta fold hydrolase [Melghirimyces profundicolus]PTX51485.1 dienelactone hydrolase family protein [Melghirimyces profundicolus]
MFAPKNMRSESFVLDLGKENRVIRGEVRLPDSPGPHPAAIICHGFKGFKDWGFFPHTGRFLAESGLAAVTFDFSMNGVGEDPETFSELNRFARNTFSREQEDLRFLVRKMKERKLPFGDELDTGRFALLGHSRGGANSLLFALDHPEVAGVVLWNSVSRVDFFSDELKREIREKGRGFIPNARTGQDMPVDREVLDDIESNRERFDLLRRLRSFDKPILILQGDEDPSVPVQSAEALREACPRSQLILIRGAGHTFNATHPFRGPTDALNEALDHTLRFFLKIFN